MRILVSGGAGFIGSNVVEYHLTKGDSVHVIDDLSTGSRHNIAPFVNNSNFMFEKSDLLTHPHLDERVDWADRVYHLAATIGMFRVLAEPIKVITNNVFGCERIFNAAIKLQSPPKIIFASSSSVYGQTHDTDANEESQLILSSHDDPLHNYALSKITGEALAKAYYQKYNLPVIILRIFNTIGPRQTGQYGMVVPRFIGQACRGEPITVFGEGAQTRSFCDVRDVIAIFNCLADHPDAAGQIINVGNPQEISINDLALLVKRHAKSKSVIHHISYEEAYGHQFVDIKMRRPDIRKLLNMTDFKHQWTLDRTIADLVECFSIYK